MVDLYIHAFPFHFVGFDETLYSVIRLLCLGQKQDASGIFLQTVANVQLRSSSHAANHLSQDRQALGNAVPDASNICREDRCLFPSQC